METNRLNTVNAFALLSAGIIAGSLVGVVRFLYHILSNRYFQYKAYGLIVWSFPRFLNSTILYFILGSLGFFLFLVFWTRIVKLQYITIVKMTVFPISLCLSYLVIDLVLKLVTSDHLLASMRAFAARVKGSLAGSAAASAHSSASGGFLLPLFLILLLILLGLGLYRFLRTVRWKAVGRFLETMRVRIGSLLLILLVVSGDIVSVVYGRMICPDTPNVILIGIDTLRADHVSSYGYERETSPNIDAIAQAGVVFSKCYSTTSWTLPSFASMFTSLYQASHGVVTGRFKLRESFLTLTELLKNKGYKTAGFISGPYLKSQFGFKQGFDLYDESASSESRTEAHKAITCPRLSELILPWLAKNKDSRFFLFIHYWDPHYDYIPPSPFNKTFDPDYPVAEDVEDIGWWDIEPSMDPRDLEHVVALYDGEIRWTDEHLGRLFAALKQYGLDENTVIVIVGDHGDEFLEHGQRGHRNNLYNEVIHVPLILKVPGKHDPMSVNSTVSIVDILPTVADLLGLEYPADVEGISLLPFVEGSSIDEPRQVFSELNYSQKALVQDGWKIIYNLGSGSFELYDIKNDPSEQNNLIEVRADKARELGETLMKWVIEKNAQASAAPGARVNGETLEQLKSLGYM